MTPPTVPKAIFFDIGETILDRTAEYAAWARWFGVSTHTFSAVFGALVAVGGGVQDVIEFFRPGTTWAAERKAMQASSVVPDATEADLYPDARSTLAELQAMGLFVGVVGNQPRALGDELRALRLPADHVAVSTELGVAKPAPEFFLRCAEIAGCAPGELVYVGDQLANDVAAPVAAGVQCIRVRTGPWGLLTTDPALEQQCLAVVRALAEIPAVLAARRA